MLKNISKKIVKIYLFSGYPRSMRDTKEYLETVGRLDGVILLNWTEKTLQTQVDAQRAMRAKARLVSRHLTS